MGLQVQTIEENLQHYENMTLEKKQHIENVRQCCAATFQQKFNIKYLRPEANIVPQFETVSRQPPLLMLHFFK